MLIYNVILLCISNHGLLQLLILRSLRIALMEGSLQGFDDQGNALPSLQEFWESRKTNEERTTWFEKSREYWDVCSIQII